MKFELNRKTKSILASALAVSIVVPAGALLVSGTTAFDGDFDSGTFSAWDGVSYDFSWYDPTKTSYTIDSAAQLAALSILTNDLSTTEYSDFASTLTNVPAEYLSTVDDFEGKTITLSADIDLQGHSWLPISYPWDTPNVTKGDYDALGHVPEDLTAVDSWVGDENGDMINTRYLEYPEAEMRFRDLLYAEVLTDGYYMDKASYHNYDGELNRESYSGDVLAKNVQITDAEEEYGELTYSTAMVNAQQEWDGDDTSIAPLSGTDVYFPPSSGYKFSDKQFNTRWGDWGALGYLYWHWSDVVVDTTTDDNGNEIDVIGVYVDAACSTIDDVPKYRKLSLNSTDIIASYTYADIAPYSDIYGFNGTFDGNNFRIKGLHPETPWTEDTLGRLTTYDPIGKGLFSYLGTEGIIKDLNIKGEYTDDDIVSYSSFLCAYNYGEIDNCYVHGDMEQGLVTQIYPIRRDYGPDGTSTYELSTTSGTVLPVGNSGFVSAVNNGVIKNTVTAGEVTQAYRQFGFISCINNRTIENCVNRADFSTKEVETDFITDEWSYDYDFYDNFNFSSLYKPNTASMTQADIDSFWAKYPDVDQGMSIWDWATISTFSYWDEFLKYTAAYIQGIATDGTPWVPGQYNTDAEESVAANHLYGVYGYTAVGGICAVNDGEIIGSTNEGNIEVMYNTSTRNKGNLYAQGDGETEADYLSYIRPTNVYGLFSTQADTMNVASGVVAINRGELEDCTNTGIINERAYTDRDYITLSETLYTQMTYTENGFYANDCIVYTDNIDEYVYNPLGIRWWMQEGDEPFSFTRGEMNSWRPREFTPKSWTGGNGNVVPDDPNIGVTYTALPYIGNMPYPMFQKSFVYSIEERHPYVEYSGKASNTALVYAEDLTTEGSMYSTYQVTAGICSHNLGDINGAENSGKAKSGIVYVSDGLDEALLLSNLVQTGDCEFNIGYFLRNTDISGASITNANAHQGIAHIVCSDEIDMKHQDISIYEGKGGYTYLFGDLDNRIEVSNVFIYDKVNTSDGLCRQAYNTDFDDIVSFQTSTNGVSEIYSCNISDAYMYGDAVSDVSRGKINEGCGIGNGFVAEYLTNLNFYGSSASFALGDFVGGTYTDLHVNTIQEDGTLGLCHHILTAKSADISDMLAFTNTDDCILEIKNCQVSDVNVYGDTPEFTNDGEYRYYFEYSDCEDMILQTNINIEWKNPNRYSAAQYIPGVLKTIGDTNTFKDCVIQTPNGAVSYPTYNFMLDNDTTIMSDAILAYDPLARESGALAYYMDNGGTAERTYNYTVAKEDSEDILEEIEDLIELDRVDVGVRTRDYPAYTREKVSVDEESYYKLAIPFTSNGAGEVIGSVYRDGTEYQTLATEQIFPVTDLYMTSGETVELEAVEEPGYGMIKWSMSVGGETTELPYKRGRTEEVTMGSSDIVILSEWSDLYEITVEDNPNVLITTSATKSAAGHTVYVDTMLQREDYVIDKVWYYPYKLNDSNRKVLDTSYKYEIDMNEMCFEMPSYDVQVFVSLLGTDVSVQRFILNGYGGVIDNDARTIEIVMEGSADLTSTYPEVFETNGTVAITPDPSEYQDFTKPVVYTLKAENGTEVNYTVTVTATADGEISYFDILGKVATIDQDLKRIDISISSDIDLTNVQPKIIWNGTAITPEGYVDLSGGSIVYEVTSSTGAVNTYTVVVTAPDSSKPLQAFHITVPDLDAVSWVIDETKKTITATVPYGTALHDCTIDTLQWYGMQSNMHEGDKINLTKCNYLTIKADNGDVLSYAIIVTEAPFDAKVLNQFTLYGYDGVIDEENKTITITVPTKYDITAIMPDIVNFTAKEVPGAYDYQNFTNAVEYTVTAYDGTSVTYTVTVTQE